MKSFVVTLSMLLIASAVCLSQPCPSIPLPFVDNFDNPTLDSCWTWIREDASHWSLTERPGWMRIRTQPGYIISGTDHNLLMRGRPDNSYRLETKLEVAPTAEWHAAQLLVYLSDQDWVGIGIDFALLPPGYGRKVSSGAFAGGNGLWYNYVDYPGTVAYLRVEVIDTLVAVCWSPDSVNWNVLHRGTVPWVKLSDVHIGLQTENGPGQQGQSAPEIPADFDYFKVTSLSDNQLPVELVTFNAIAAEDAIRLMFSTASETNNNRFEIWRSISQEGEFRQIVELQSQGNTTTGHQYEYTDTWVNAGQIYWYYLADVDVSGTRSEHRDLLTSATAIGSNATITDYSLTAYPNPFNPQTSITFSLPEAQLVRLSVFEVTGRMVKELANSTFTAGQHQVAFKAGDLPSGVYITRIESGNFARSAKLLLLK